MAVDLVRICATCGGRLVLCLKCGKGLHCCEVYQVSGLAPYCRPCGEWLAAQSNRVADKVYE